MANRGMTPEEIAEAMVLPESLASRFDLRGYYGSVKHNVKAVYAFYFGWYDGNPAHLDPLPREAAAGRWVEVAGGAEAMLAQGQGAYDAGEYRWGAELLNHLVFAEPSNEGARELLAKTYRQLAYQAESTQWRNSYLVAALELEVGVAEGPLVAGRLAGHLEDLVDQVVALVQDLSGVLDGQGLRQHLVHVVDEDDLETAADVGRDVFEVLLVLARDDHRVDAAAQGRDHLLLEPADRQHPPPQRHLARSWPRWSLTGLRDERGRDGGHHRDARRRTVLRRSRPPGRGCAGR